MRRGLFIAAVLGAIMLQSTARALPDQSIPSPLPVTIGTSQGKTIVGQTGSLASSATTADQVLVTYTVTSGKTFYIAYFDFTARLTTYAATATYFGLCSLESPAGTKRFTMMLANTGATTPVDATLAEPLPIASGVVVRLVCTPSAATAFTFQGNLIGYEK
jgi:hypothetical protein